MRKEGILIGLALLLLVQFASAEILISQPSGMYNYGDQLNVSITIIPKSNANDFFMASIVCQDSQIEVYRSTLGTTYGNNRVIPIEVVFDRSIIGHVGGSCYVQASYGPETATSQSFEITDAVKVSFVTDSALVEPGKSVGITGRAVKANGKDLNGFVSISLDGTSVSSQEIVKDGKFSSDFSIPYATAAGNYILSVNAFERSSGSVTNSGNSSSIVKVKAVVSGADIALSNVEVIPGDSLTYSVVLYDQTNQPIPSQEMSITLYDSQENIIFKKLIKSGESNSLDITSNFTPGNWVLETTGAGTNTRRSFAINELQNASFIVENGTLVITNTGNVPYTNPVQVKIGSESDVKDLSLDVGETKVFRLLAPDGEYPIEIVQGGNVYPLGSSFLTGNAIAIQDVEGLFTSSKYSAGIWLAIIIILIFIAVKMYSKIKERKSYGSSFSYPTERYAPKEKVVESEPVPLVKNVLESRRTERRSFERNNVPERQERRFQRPQSGFGRDEMKSIKRDVSGMEESQEEIPAPVQRKINVYNPPAMVMRKQGPGIEQGQREEAALVALKIRNYLEIDNSDSNAKESVAKVIRVANESGAKIIRDRSSILAIFSTHKFSEGAYSNALDLARQIESILLDHNRRYVHKVAFGVSIHSGELITEHIGNDFRYTSVGNAIPFTRNLADRAQSEIAVSESAISKVRNFAKLQRVQNDNYWKVLGGVERRDGKYNEFIGQFMKRQKGGW